MIFLQQRNLGLMFIALTIPACFHITSDLSYENHFH